MNVDVKTMPVETTGFAMAAADAARLINAEFIGHDIYLSGVSTDTRTLRKGELYIALRGPNFDGHNFVEAAIEKGAAACMVERPVKGPATTIVVEDTLQGMGKLAQAWRNQFDIPVVAVTGSNGKTTVKEMLASIFSQQGEVLSTQGNLNNDIGLPLTLFRLNKRHTSAVVELGANHPGEIAYLTAIARPDIAVVTNAGSAHLEGFGSVEGVARAKGEIFEGLSSQGTAIINNDDGFNPLWKELAEGKRILSFGMTAVADVTASCQLQHAGSLLSVQTPAGQVGITLYLLGRHNVMNALAAVTVAVAADVPLDAIKAGLEKVRPVLGRLELKNGIQGSRIIDDTYNANPASLKAALDVLVEFPGQHYLALGDMGELGDDADALHRKAGKQVYAAGIHRLYTLGELAGLSGKAFGEDARCFNSQSDLIDELECDLQEDITLVVKGSRRMHMEKVVDALTVNGED